MPFVHQPLGVLVSKDPVAAHAALVDLFEKHDSLVDVAESIPVDGRTLARWIKRLEKAGFQDPRKLSGVPTRPTGSDEDRARARQLALEGLPLPEIASRLGFDRRTVARWVAAP